MYGCTALHLAASKGSLLVIRALLRQSEIEVDPVDNGGRSPLHWASVSGYGDVMRMLLEAGALEARRDKEGYAGVGLSVVGWGHQ